MRLLEKMPMLKLALNIPKLTPDHNGKGYGKDLSNMRAMPEKMI
jgi:hypothetical protein